MVMCFALLVVVVISGCVLCVGCCCWLFLYEVVACCVCGLVYVVVCICRWKSVSLVCVVVGRCLLCVVIVCGMLVLLFAVLEFDCWRMLPDVFVCCCLLSVCLVLLRLGVVRCCCLMLVAVVRCCGWLCDVRLLLLCDV